MKVKTTGWVKAGWMMLVVACLQAATVAHASDIDFGAPVNGWGFCPTTGPAGTAAGAAPGAAGAAPGAAAPAPGAAAAAPGAAGGANGSPGDGAGAKGSPGGGGGGAASGSAGGGGASGSAGGGGAPTPGGGGGGAGSGSASAEPQANVRAAVIPAALSAATRRLTVRRDICIPPVTFSSQYVQRLHRLPARRF